MFRFPCIMRCVFAPQQNEALAIRLSLSSPLLALVRLSSVCNLQARQTSFPEMAQRRSARTAAGKMKFSSFFGCILRSGSKALDIFLISLRTRFENEMARQQ